jgi:hypothetical protein
MKPNMSNFLLGAALSRPARLDDARRSVRAVTRPRALGATIALSFTAAASDSDEPAPRL